MSDFQQNSLNKIQAALDNLTTARGLTTRPSQNQMISNVAQILLSRADNEPESGSNLLTIEAPTGTGKSFGYLLPAIPIAKALEKKVVVSTAVVSLQEQLIEKDLPAIAKAMPMSFTYAIAKGRSRFVCTSRLRTQIEAMESIGQDAGGKKKKKKDGPTTSDDVPAFTLESPQAEDIEILKTGLEDLTQRTWNGEQETLSWKEEKRKVLWPKVTTDSTGCSGKRCKDYNMCPYYEAKKKWQDADVIVANHDLVLSDLKADGKLISPIENTIYIFDEAHHLPGKARDAWAGNYRTDTVPKIIKEMMPNLEDIGQSWAASLCSLTKKHGDAMLEKRPALQVSAKQLDVAIKAFDTHLTRLTKKVAPKEPLMLDYDESNIDPLLMSFAMDLHAKTEEFLGLFEGIFNPISEARRTIKNPGSLHPDSAFLDDAEMNRVFGALGFYAQRTKNMLDTLALFTKEQPDVKKPPIAKWILPDEKHKNFTIYATPTMATDVLPPFLYSRAYAVVHASATLTSVGGFDLFREKTGLIYYPNSRYVKLESPFDFKKNATLVFGDMGANPSDAEAHTKRLIEVLPHLFDEYKKDNGILVLFSSKSQLEQVVQRLPWEYRQLCKVQYTEPNQVLIEKHKKDVDAGKRSILIGTQSFSEGLDLPGAWCSLVISTKLPFSMPDNPIDKTLTLWLESRGENVFRKISIPEASERLIQQAGRLIRREEDTGSFILLDNRVMNKWGAYGKAMVEALPPFARKKLDLKMVKYTPKPGNQPPALGHSAVVSSTNRGLPQLPDYDQLTFDDSSPW